MTLTLERRIVIAGIGGQGVVFAAKVLAHAALGRGLAVMASENHGMSQRGGSVMAHVRIGPDGGALIRRGTADALLAFDRTEAMRHAGYVRAGGQMVVNDPTELNPLLAGRLAELGVAVHCLDAGGRARALGAPAALNLVVLGFAAARPDFGLDLDDLRRALASLGPARALDVNQRALETGAALALAPAA